MYEVSSNVRKAPRRLMRIVAVLLCMLLLLAAIYSYYSSLNQSPLQFPVGVDVVVEEGSTVGEITTLFKENNIVRSSFYFYMALIQSGSDTNIQAGVYRFTSPLTTHEIVNALTTGTSMSPLAQVTFPEGFRASQIYDYLPASFTEATIDVTDYEGYLFPDTYFISNDMSTDALIDLLRSTFTEKLEPFNAQIEASGFTLHEVITFASIIEREAKDTESKHLVAGVLHNRLLIDMPLQVDAVFDYLLDKTSAELTLDDLAIDSPYNTYRYRGLPPGPIANPSLDSIRAVLEPTPSEYLYYLTADDGTFHYATTFKEHVENKRLYLR